MFKVIFLFSFAILLYTWVVYPAMISILARTKRRGKTPHYRELPYVSVIIAAYNEEGVIARRIENLLQQDYPKYKIEIILASDGSIDRTVEIVNKFEGVNVLNFKENRGRAAVYNDAAKEARGEIILFTDAETEFESGFIRKIAGMYSDPNFGVGAGDLTFRSTEDFGESEGIYWKMEKVLRYYEYLLDILPFASGACFSIRRKLYEQIPVHSDIDNILPLRVIQKGYKVFYCNDAIAYEYTVSNTKQLFRKRYRTALRSMSDILSELPNLMRKKKVGILFVLFSHRLLRWWSSLLLPSVFLFNFKLLNNNLIYQSIFVCQIIFYFLVLLGFMRDRFYLPQIIYRSSNIAYSFVIANLAFIFAIFGYILKRRITSYKT